MKTTENDYRTSIAVPIDPDKAIVAINNVPGWWAKNFEGHAQKLHDVFTVRFGETFVTFEIAELVPDRRVVWQVNDCYLHWLSDKKEWMNTSVVWDLTPQKDGLKIDMAHIGLKPGVECYDNCVKGWDGFIKGSLYQLLTTGKGQPSK